MRRRWIAGLILSGLLLSGCQAGRPLSETAGECLEPVSPDAVSQDVYDALQAEWDAWNRMSAEAQMLSSHMPGWCRRSFDGWAECEAFLGLSIPNPLEACDWLEQGTCAAMPLGFRDAPRVQAGWYGTEDGHVEWISAQAGYRNGQVRVTVDAMLYGDPADAKSPEGGWSSVELERQSYLESAEDAPPVTSDRTENYFSNTAWRARGPVLYRLGVIGEPDMETQVEETMEQVLDAFFETQEEG